ncbi:tyrosine-type recombinase/integrase [Pseudomonas bubulae]|uniref:tyrosine-type recombinase/integrase n=1 Tax=Pseudomonas bubulae TaxID=2316085 RepID=UPI002B1D98D7|nr:tyrosine-type recombinase/integrase [Pseudomonas bubulae]
MGLGSVHTVSLEEARDMAKAARLCVLKGIDPVEQHRQDRLRRHLEQVECPDFDSCVAAYIARHAVAWKSAKHRQQWENTLRTYASPIIGPVKVRYIDTSMILQVLQPIWTLRPETANRLRGRLERILAWAKVLGYRQGENPARWRGHLQELLPRREAIQAVRHHPALPHEHMAGFWAVLLGHTGSAALAMQLTILTACRTSEVLGARWEEFDWDNLLWTIPAERMKLKRAHRVPLISSMQVILEAQRGQDAVLVFPGRRAGRPLSNMSMLMLLRRLTPAVLTVHGFRSTFRDWAAERTDYPSEIVEMALAHQVGSKVEYAYLRTDFFARRRQLLSDWAKYCTACVQT